MNEPNIKSGFDFAISSDSERLLMQSVPEELREMIEVFSQLKESCVKVNEAGMLLAIKLLSEDWGKEENKSNTKILSNLLGDKQ